jgi:NADPH-dependent 2,4-dienoyl-CoA reductase/sulfur reductase-like enzyme
MVIGGGLAGMEAARTLAERGHYVHLYEKNDHLGGQWVPSSRPDYKTDYRTFIPYLVKGLEKNDVKISLSIHVTKNLLEKEKPEVVVLATGAAPRELNVDKPLEGGPEIVQGVDVIMGKEVIGNRIVVIGGRYIGMEVAEELSMRGKNVSIVEAFALGHGTNVRLKGYMLNRLAECGVRIYDNSPVLRISTSGVDIANNGIMLSLKADTVVLAVGTQPVNDLGHALERLGIEFHTIGDCSMIGDALDAIADGAEIGRAI